MRRPPKLEFKTAYGSTLLDPADVLEIKTALSGAVIESHTENHGEDGVVEAYVAVTGTRDEVGDVIEHRAFDRTLKALRPKMCLGHDWNRPIGEPEEIRFLAPGDPDLPEATADGAPWPAEAGALYTKNRYLLGTQDGRDAYEHAKFYKGRTAYSIGYVVKKFRIGLHKGLKTRFIEDLDLYEYGPVLHGAHNLARQRSIKTGEPSGVEHKMRKVHDASYWGYPVGTPITANMRPKGPTARKLRKEGKVPDRSQGTTDSVTAAGKPAPSRTTPAKATADANATGLFPEPATDQRLRASNPKGNDAEHVNGLISVISDDVPHEDGDLVEPFRGLLDEGITPAELEDDLRNAPPPDGVDDWHNRIDDVIAAYQSSYGRETRRQQTVDKGNAGGGADQLPRNPKANPKNQIDDILLQTNYGRPEHQAKLIEKAHARLIADGVHPDEVSAELDKANPKPGLTDEQHRVQVDAIAAEHRSRYDAALAGRNGGGDAATAGDGNAPAGAPADGGTDGEWPTDFQQHDPPTVKKGDTLHTVTAPNGQKFYRGSSRPYTHAVVAKSPRTGQHAAYSFHSSPQNAQSGINELRRRGHKGPFHVLETDPNHDGKPDSPAVDPNAPQNAAALARSADLPGAPDGATAPAEVDKTTRAMWKANPDRAARRLPPGAKAEYDALKSPARQDNYAHGRINGEDHATALGNAGIGAGSRDETGKPLPDAATPSVGDPGSNGENAPAAPADGVDNTPDIGADNSATETGQTAGGAPTAADTGAPNADATPAAPAEGGTISAAQLAVGDVYTSPESGHPVTVTKVEPRPNDRVRVSGSTPDGLEMNLFDNGEQLPRAGGDASAEGGTPADLTPDEQAWASDRNAAAAALPDDQRAAYDALDEQGKHSYATARISGENHDDAMSYALHRSTPAPGVATPTGAPMTPNNLANALAAKPDRDLSDASTEMLKNTDAEFASRAEQLGKPGAVTQAHQNLKDEIAKREAAGPDTAPAADAGTPAAGPQPGDDVFIGMGNARFEFVQSFPNGTSTIKSTSSFGGRQPAARTVPTDKLTDRPGQPASWATDAAAPGTPNELPTTPNVGVQPGADVPSEPAPDLGNAPDAATGLAIPGADVTPGADNVQTPAQPQGPSVADEAARTLDPQATAQIGAEDIAEANATADASFGVTEADDGAFEVDTDVADRQDRVSALLAADSVGGLSLGTQNDDQLRSTRADVVNEIKLQDHLSARERNTAVPTRAQRGDAGATGETGDGSTGGDTTPPAPKVRPGLAGALEDLADALDGPDQDAVDRARARLESSLRRSKSDSDVVNALRAIVESGQADIDPALLRSAAEAIRAETRAKRNEQARNRRTARRLDRERLRSLLGSVDAEMRRRNLSYDPVPGLDGDADTTAPAAGGPAPGTWRKGEGNWATANTSEVSGTGYHADINTIAGMNRYTWTVTGDDGTELASGSGNTDDAEVARTTIAHALATQQTLGRIPSDSVLPPLPATDTVPARREAERSAVDAIRNRLTDPTRNPITGLPNPLAAPTALRAPSTSAFPDAAAVRAHLEVNAAVVGEMTHPARNIRWDDVTLTPGGGLAVGTDLRGDPTLFHTGSGRTLPPFVNGARLPMTKADLLKLGTYMESMPDANGRTADFANADYKAVAADTMNWQSPATGENLLESAVGAVVADKIRAGRWSDPVVRKARLKPVAGDGTNPSRRGQIDDLHRMLGQMINVRSGPVPKEDKKTLDIAAGARQLTNAGAPDAAAVVLRRRAAELRDLSGKADAAEAAAKDGGLDRPNLARAAQTAKTSAMTANLLDDIANTHLSMHSPTPSPGSRALRLQPGERLAFPEGDGVRTYRVLSPMRSSGDDPNGTFGSYAQVMDEATGQQLTAGVIGGRGMSPVLQVYDPEAKIGVFSGSIHSTPLGGNGFVVLDEGQPAPAHDGFSEAGLADIGSIPVEALDRAAEELPETPAETSARRAVAPAGGRAPARRSQAAPKRTAPAAVIPPSENEAKLAQSQVTARNLWQKAPYEAADAQPGGFKNFDEVIANAHALVAANPGYRNPKASSAEAAFIQIADAPPASGLPEGGAKLSPGGHLVIQKNGAIAHARTGVLLWTPSMAQRLGAGDADQTSPALTARIADYIERGDFGGQPLKLDTTNTDEIVASAKAITDRTGAHPLATATRAAYVDHLATASRPTASDVAGLEAMTGDVRPADFLPNPDVFTANLNVGATEGSYNALGGKRVNNVRNDDLPKISNSKEGQTLAKRIATEYALTRAQAKVAPLDAVRRLNALADELDGRTIESSDGKSFTPATDLRARAQAISDAYDDTKPSPMGLLARGNFNGTVVPDLAKADISVGQLSGRDAGYTSEGTRNVRLAKLKTELREGGTVKFERGESGNLRATLAGRTVEDGVDGGKVVANSDGSLAVSWREDLYGGAGEPKVRMPAGTWKLDGGNEPSSPGDVSDAEYETHVADIEAKLSAALSDGQATDISMTIGHDGQSWTPERAQLHNEIVNEMWQAGGASVPAEGRAVITGGLGGAGKSTVLKGYAGIDSTQYFTINSDDVKAKMAERDMVPTVEGLSPLEASALVHVESGHVANLLAGRAYANNTNVVWDTTMGSRTRIEARIAEMRDAGYGVIGGVFVDIPVETSVERAMSRHREGMAQQAAGKGFGGRYVPPSAIRAKTSDTASSTNRETFDALKPKLDSWVIYDNSVAGREPKKVADSGNWGGESQVAPVAPKAPEVNPAGQI